MLLLKITDPYVTLNSNLYKDVTLLKDKTYLLEKSHALILAEKGFGEIVESVNRIPHFTLSELKWHKSPLKLLFLFNGSLGDAISLAYLLMALQLQYNIVSNVACDSYIWDNIFKPLGHSGKHYSLPIEIDDINIHDFIQTRADLFFEDKNEKWDLCIVEELSKAYRVKIQPDSIQFTIPEDTVEKHMIPESSRIRVGLNFESKGLIRSYPQDLQPALIHNLLSIGSEIFIFGLKKLNMKGLEKEKYVHDLCGKTTIPELSFWINRMDLVICMDSFIAHLSNVLDVKTLVLLSVTRKGVFRWHKQITCIESGIECSPCGEIANKCPKGFDQCKAFFHDSITPAVITYLTSNECVSHFNQLIQSSIQKNDQVL